MAMEQHPIPQDVTGYKFRLVGDMTLTQFLQLAGGIVGGVIFYALPLPFFFKYPLAILSVGLGVGMAFVPVQGRPMGQWILAFIKSIYSPTMYVCKKQENKPAPNPTPTSTTNQNNAKQITTNNAPANNTSNLPQTSPSPQLTPPPTPKPPQNQPTPPIPNPQPQIANNGASQVTISNSPSATPDQITKLPTLFTPTTPNTLTGMTLTPDGKILEDVIIELQKDGLTARATKSNKLGQFLFASPLDNGTYHIITEKNGFTFQKYALNFEGKIISPLKLQATSTQQQATAPAQ
jgi:hypothetical protein